MKCKNLLNNVCKYDDGDCYDSKSCDDYEPKEDIKKKQDNLVMFAFKVCGIGLLSFMLVLAILEILK